MTMKCLPVVSCIDFAYLFTSDGQFISRSELASREFGI